MRLWNAFKLDIKSQMRNGLYTIYVVISMMYCVMINQLSAEVNQLFIPILIFSDPAVLGFFFIGGIVMLEKSQGVLELLVITPLRIKEYLGAKIMSLTMISVVAGIAISVVSGVKFNLVGLVLGIALTASFFTLFGFLLAVRSETMNQYFGKVIPAMMLIVVPCFSLIEFRYNWIFSIFPSVAAVRLLVSSFVEMEVYKAVIFMIILLIWNYVMYRYVMYIFNEYVVEGGDRT